MSRFPLANFSKLPEGTKFPLVNVAFSAGSLFDSGWRGDLKDIEGWHAHQAAHMGVPMAAGPAMSFFKKLIALNEYTDDKFKRPLVHAHIVSRYRAEPEAMMRLFNSLEHHGLVDHADTTFISTSFLGGVSPMASIVPLSELLAHGVALYVGTDTEVVKELIAKGVPAAVALPAGDIPEGFEDHRQPDQLALGFDGDSTIFGRSSDDAYVLGLEPFKEYEALHRDDILEDGPMQPALAAFSRVRELFPRQVDQSPLKLVFATMRGPKGYHRVPLTLLEWKRKHGIRFDQAAFNTHLLAKGPFLLEFGVDLFLDDGLNHVRSAQQHGVAAGHVPFGPKNESKPGVLLDEHGITIKG